VSKAPAGVTDLDESNPELVEYVPACVRTCAPKARFFGDLDNPDSTVSKLIADKRGVRLKDETGNRPQVYYLSGGAGASMPSSRATTPEES
jgi:molybdopterin-containing oxidoreductase family iron-sulfur binding subunit